MWEKLSNLFGGSVLKEVTDLVRTFKLPPEQQLAFEQKAMELEQQAKLRLAELEASSVDGARKREMEIKDYVPGVLATVVSVGFFGGTFYFAHNTVNPQSVQIVHDMLLTLRDGWFAIIMYYFGYSHASSKNGNGNVK